MRSTSSGTVLQRPQLLRTASPLGADVEQAGAPEAPEVGEAHVLGEAPVEDEALRLAVLGREPEAGPDRPAGAAARSRLPATKTSPSSGSSMP